MMSDDEIKQFYPTVSVETLTTYTPHRNSESERTIQEIARSQPSLMQAIFQRCGPAGTHGALLALLLVRKQIESLQMLDEIDVPYMDFSQWVQLDDETAHAIGNVKIDLNYRPKSKILWRLIITLIAIILVSIICIILAMHQAV